MRHGSYLVFEHPHEGNATLRECPAVVGNRDTRRWVAGLGFSNPRAIGASEVVEGVHPTNTLASGVIVYSRWRRRPSYLPSSQSMGEDNGQLSFEDLDTEPAA